MINKVYEKQYELDQKMKAMQKDYEEKLQQQNESHLCAMEEMKRAYDAKLQEVTKTDWSGSSPHYTSDH